MNNSSVNFLYYKKLEFKEPIREHKGLVFALKILTYNKEKTSY
tara:strand:- start:323 stop:451 length:129 start_codon:yes stop_codon:yes gene_type:complete